MVNAREKIRRVFEEHGVVGSIALCARLPVSPLLRSDLGTRLRRAYHGWAFDRRFGVDTSGFIEQPVPGVGSGIASRGRPYDGSNPSHFNRIIRGLNLRYQGFSFIDFGSGKGRALLLAAGFPFRSITGVEWSDELHQTAARNIETYRGPRICTDVRSHCMDAAEFPIPQGKCLLYFFNPFKDEVMGRVVENVATSFEANPREMIIVYINPKNRGIFDGQPFIRTTTDRGWFVVYRTLLPHKPSTRAGNESAFVGIPA